MSGTDRYSDEKARIQQRYRGIAPEKLEMIPAINEASFYEDRSERRVAVYVRVSTDDPRQTSSFELQRNHYEDVVQRHAGWHLVDIYADAADIIGLNQNPITTGADLVLFFLVFSQKTRRMEDVTA